MTKQELQKIQVVVQLALEKEGYKLSKTTGQYGDGHGKLNLTILDKGGNAKTPEAKAYEVNAEHLGMKAEWLGKLVTINGTNYKIEGLKAAARKYPVLGSRESDGKMYKFPIETVRGAFRAAGLEVPESWSEHAASNAVVETIPNPHDDDEEIQTGRDRFWDGEPIARCTSSKQQKGWLRENKWLLGISRKEWEEGGTNEWIRDTIRGQMILDAGE